MDVYEPHEDDTGISIGILTKVNDDEAPFLMKAHNYIIGKTIKVRKKDYVMCVLSKRAYLNDKYKGKAMSTSKNRYKIVKE